MYKQNRCVTEKLHVIFLQKKKMNYTCNLSVTYYMHAVRKKIINALIWCKNKKNVLFDFCEENDSGEENERLISTAIIGTIATTYRRWIINTFVNIKKYGCYF